MKLIAVIMVSISISISAFGIDEFQGLKFGSAIAKEGLQKIGLPLVCKITCSISQFGNDKYQLAYEPGVEFLGQKRTTILILGSKEELQQGWIFLPYNKDLYLTLKKALKEKYTLEKDITGEDISSLDKGINHTIVAAFDNAQVLLTITKDPETKKMDMLLMYLDKGSAKEAAKKILQPKKSLKDEI